MAQTAMLSPANLARKNQRILPLKGDPDQKSVIEMSFAVANYYIPYHLRDTCKQDSLRGLPKHYLIPPAQPSETFTHVTKLCTQMEQDSSSFFEGLPQRMNLRAENAKATFMSLSKRVVCHDGINWGRIMSIYTLGGAFAVHFVNKGQIHIVPKIAYWIQEVVEKHLVDWIIQEGGWDNISKKCGDTQSSWTSYVTVGVFAAAGILMLGFRK